MRRVVNVQPRHVVAGFSLRSLALLLLLTLTAGAQQQPQQPQPQQAQQPQQPFTLQVNTQLVVETVVVKDKDGKDITGLTDKDFIVTEDNVPQTISVFEYQKLDDSATPAPAAQPAAPPLDATAPLTIASRVAVPPPGDARYRGRRLMVLFFDTSASPPP